MIDDEWLTGRYQVTRRRLVKTIVQSGDNVLGYLAKADASKEGLSAEVRECFGKSARALDTRRRARAKEGLSDDGYGVAISLLCDPDALCSRIWAQRADIIGQDLERQMAFLGNIVVFYTRNQANAAHSEGPAYASWARIDRISRIIASRHGHTSRLDDDHIFLVWDEIRKAYPNDKNINFKNVSTLKSWFLRFLSEATVLIEEARERESVGERDVLDWLEGQMAGRRTRAETENDFIDRTVVNRLIACLESLDNTEREVISVRAEVPLNDVDIGWQSARHYRQANNMTPHEFNAIAQAAIDKLKRCLGSGPAG